MVAMWRQQPAGTGKAYYKVPAPPVADWMARAACSRYGHDLWFPDDEPDPRRRATMRRLARDICLACPVARQCGDYARATGATAGIWAGIDHSGKPPKQRKGTTR